MNLESLERSLLAHPFVLGMPERAVAFLTGCTKNVRLERGEYLFREGEAADYLYLLREGRVDLSSAIPGRGSVTLETLEPGEALGASVIFPPYAWHIDAQAMAPVLAFRVDGACLRIKLDSDPEFAAALLKRLLLDVHGRLARARLHQLDVYKKELRGPVP